MNYVTAENSRAFCRGRAMPPCNRDAVRRSGQTVITVAEAADFAATLEREFAVRK